MMKNILISVILTILLLGCGNESFDNDVNSNKAKNSLGYYDDLSILYDQVITGFWIERDKKYGFEWMYYLENSKTLDMNDTIVDAFYNNQAYGVDVKGNQLSNYKFNKSSETITEIIDGNETNTTIYHYDYNTSIIESRVYSSVNHENSCFNISKYETKEGQKAYLGAYEFCANQGFTQQILATHSLAGLWIQYDYDANDTAKTDNSLGIEFLYKFDTNGRVSMNISIINTWIPLGKYATNEENTILTFEEGSNTSLKQFEFIEDRDSVPFQYKDKDNVTQTRDMPCIKIAKYSINENNSSKTFDSYQQLCQKY